MKRSPAGIGVALLALVAAAYPSAAAEQVPYPTESPTAENFPAQGLSRAPRLDVDVWINKDEGGIYRPGESMRVYFRANVESYVLVFNVDTDGYIHLIYPYGPEDPPTVEGGRAYRVPARSDPYDLVADGPPGIEYVVAVASPYPFENLPWYLTSDRADGARPEYDEDSNDDMESGHIAGDPYVGIDRIVRRIAPEGREDRVATSETYFYIGRRVEYPRYVCADCHYHPFYFDPYVNACSVFEIRVDATWAHYAPIRYGTVRPRYIYRVRSQAPTRYRQWKSQWSSLDGRTTLRTRFLPERDVRYRRDHAPRTRTERPEVRDLRRYREGRIWRGRDEILRLREQRDRAGAPEDRSRDRVRSQPDRGGWRDRGGNPNAPEDRGYRQRGERRRPDVAGDRRPPEDRGAHERERPQPREDQGNRQRERMDRENRREQERPQQREDRGDRERERPQQQEQQRDRRDDRPQQRDDGNDHQQQDQGNRDRNDRSNDRGWWRGDPGR